MRITSPSTPLGLLTAAAGPDVPSEARWLQLRHAAELLDRTPETIARWRRGGKLGQGPPTRGGGRKVPRADIADLLRSTNGDEPHQGRR